MRTVENLTEKENVFCVAYTTIGSESYSNGTAAAKEAGYPESSAGNAAWKLLKRPAVRQRIAQIHQANMSRNYLTVDKVLSDLEHLRIKAESKGDLATACRCSEDQGKFLAMFTERQVFFEPEKPRELDERQQAEVIKIANIRVREQMAEDSKQEGRRSSLREALPALAVSQAQVIEDGKSKAG